MKVLLINCPIRETSKPNVIPTGLSQISAVLKQAQHKVDLLDINGLRIDKNKVEKYIQDSKDADVYGISGLITTYKYQKWLIQTIRKYSNNPIVCGGGCANSAGDLLKQYGADIIIKGEGENQLPSFLQTKKYSDISDIPFPDWDNLPMDVYLKNPIWGSGTGNTSNTETHPDMLQERSMNIVTSRGCPYSCYFCSTLFARGHKQRTVENVIEEVIELKKRYDIDFVGFVDDNMFVNREWVLEFCTRMELLNILWGCHARVNEVDDELLKATYKAGCRWIGYGIESGSQRILNAMNKKVWVEQAKETIELTRENHIYPNTSFIYGYPGECDDTVRETIRFCKSLKLHPKFFHSTAYPETPLYKKNENRILSRYLTYENYIESLGDAKDFIINLTGMTDKKYFNLKINMEKELN